MNGLKIAPKLVLPLDVVGEAIGILAKRGAGKTNTAKVLVEEMLDNDVQVVVLDPVGVWWGLRSAAEGGEGYPIAVLGGEHGDVPLEASAGGLVAEVVVESGQSLVLDVSDFSKTEQRRFVADFATRLYRRKARARSLLHVVLEEADEFAPQRVTGGDAPMVGAISLIVKRGRSRGLGLTFITQRSASLNKDVLDQADVLVVMRTIGPRDRRAIEGWIEHQDAAGADEVLPSLPSLDTGEAWIWNPERGMLARAHVRKARTFDSSATPKAGAKKTEPKAIAPIDLDALGTRIRETAERAKENDPRELHQKIRRLERELAERPTETEKVVERVPIEVPVLSNEDIERLEDRISAAHAIAAEIEELPSALRAAAEQLGAALARVSPGRSGLGQDEPKRQAPEPLQQTRQATSPARRPAPGSDDTVQLKAGARRILETLARHHPMRVTRAQLGTLARFKITGGTFQTYFSQLKRFGLIDESDGEISITDGGLDYVGHVPAAPQTTEELLEMWRGALKAGARSMLDVLVDRYPNELTKDELAEAVEMTVSGGTFQTYLSTLRRNGLAHITGAYVRASDTLFLWATR